MVWPIGQPAGEMRQIALRSRQIWLEALEASKIWHRQSGSLHLAYAHDELGVLQQFIDQAPEWGYECEAYSPEQVARKSPFVKQEGLMGAMWSPSELCVFPRQVVWEFPAYLSSQGVEFHFASAVTHVETGRIVAAGRDVLAEKILVCSGDDFETLFPHHFATSGLTRSKLQMMRARARTPNFELGTHLCAGLTLGHYANFRTCSKLETLLQRFKTDYPEHEKWGIHLLVSQHEDGLLTIGDSHEYGLAVTPYMQTEIDRLIWEYLDSFLPTDQLEIVERWYGVYAKHPTKNYLIDEVARDVHVITGVGGAGMTLSFGITEKALREAGILDGY